MSSQCILYNSHVAKSVSHGHDGAAHSLSDFVHLVDEDQRVFRLHLLQTLDHLTRHGAHVRPAVTRDVVSVR